jgi:predicted dehydrogenase
MADKAQTLGVKHMVLYTYRWFPIFRYLHDLVNQGYVGRVYHCDFSLLWDGGRNPEYQWRYDRQRSNGTLADLGSHMIDMARYLVGDIVSVRAHLGVFVNRPGPDGQILDPANDSALLLVEFANGAHGTIQASEVAYLADRGLQLQVKLYGEAGTLEVDVSFGADDQPTIRGARSQDEKFQLLEVPESYLAGLPIADPWAIFTRESVGARQFIDGILSNQPVSPNFWDGYKNQLVINAAVESDQQGTVIAIRPDTRFRKSYQG